MTAALTIQNLTKVYGSGFKAVEDLNLEVAPGDFFALLGPNGAGKSTTIGIISSIVNKTQGKVEIFGTDIDTDFSKAKQFLGVVPQEVNFNQFENPLDILLYQAGFYGIGRAEAKCRAEKLLNLMSLWDKRNQPSRSLSGGMKRRLMIARALIHNPKLLILDEPTAGVDIELRRSTWEIMQSLNESGTTIILTTHYLEEAESLCKNIAIIDQGKIVTHTSMKALLSQLSTQSYVLDLSCSLAQAPQLEGIAAQLVDAKTLEAQVNQEHTICELFDWLIKQKVNVLSLRNKTNRLEELFLNLTHSKLKD